MRKIYARNSQNLLTVLVDHLLNIFKEFENLFREKGNLKHLYKYELDKACFSHDAGYYDLVKI